MRLKIIVTAVLLALTATFPGCSAQKTPLSAENKSEAGAFKNVYLSGPFFNETEIKNIEYAEKILTEKGFSLFSPMRHEVDAEPGTNEWAEKIFEVDRDEIEKADLMVVLYYGNNSDTGTAWECGYASAIEKPIVLVHVNRDGDSNLMMHCGCTTNIYLDELADFDFDAMPVHEYEGKMF